MTTRQLLCLFLKLYSRTTSMNLRHDNQSLAEHVIVGNVLNVKRAKYIKIWLVQNMYSMYRYICLPSQQLTVCTWKLLVGRWCLSFFGSFCLFSRVFFPVGYRAGSLNCIIRRICFFLRSEKPLVDVWCLFLLGWKNAPVFFNLCSYLLFTTSVIICIVYTLLPSWELTCPLETSRWKSTFLLKWPLFRGHVCFRECSSFMFAVQLIIFQLAMSTWTIIGLWLQRFGPKMHLATKKLTSSTHSFIESAHRRYFLVDSWSNIPYPSPFFP